MGVLFLGVLGSHYLKHEWADNDESGYKRWGSPLCYTVAFHRLLV